MQLALGPEGKRNQEIPRTHRFNGGGGSGDVAFERIYRFLGFGNGESGEVVGSMSRR